MVPLLCPGGSYDGDEYPELLCGVCVQLDPACFGTSRKVVVRMQRFGLQPILLADTKDTTVGKSTTKPTKSRHALAAFCVWLDGEGVFEFFHPRFQILDFAPLLFDEQVFNAV
jgi:hypothetical protein